MDSIFSQGFYISVTRDRAYCTENEWIRSKMRLVTKWNVFNNLSSKYEICTYSYGNIHVYLTIIIIMIWYSYFIHFWNKDRPMSKRKFAISWFSVFFLWWRATIQTQVSENLRRRSDEPIQYGRFWTPRFLVEVTAFYSPFLRLYDVIWVSFAGNDIR